MVVLVAESLTDEAASAIRSHWTRNLNRWRPVPSPKLHDGREEWSDEWLRRYPRPSGRSVAEVIEWLVGTSDVMRILIGHAYIGFGGPGARLHTGLPNPGDDGFDLVRYAACAAALLLEIAPPEFPVVPPTSDEFNGADLPLPIAWLTLSERITLAAVKGDVGVIGPVEGPRFDDPQPFVTTRGLNSARAEAAATVCSVLNQRARDRLAEALGVRQEDVAAFVHRAIEDQDDGWRAYRDAAWSVTSGAGNRDTDSAGFRLEAAMTIAAVLSGLPELHEGDFEGEEGTGRVISLSANDDPQRPTFDELVNMLDAAVEAGEVGAIGVA